MVREERRFELKSLHSRRCRARQRQFSDPVIGIISSRAPNSANHGAYEPTTYWPPRLTFRVTAASLSASLSLGVCAKLWRRSFSGAARDFWWIACRKRLLQLPIQFFIELPLFTLFRSLLVFRHSRNLHLGARITTATAPLHRKIEPLIGVQNLAEVAAGTFPTLAHQFTGAQMASWQVFPQRNSRAGASTTK